MEYNYHKLVFKAIKHEQKYITYMKCASLL